MSGCITTLTVICHPMAIVHLGGVKLLVKALFTKETTFLAFLVKEHIL